MNKLENKSSISPFPFQEGYFGDNLLTARASGVLLNGGAVAMQMRGVFGLWANANNPGSLALVREIKQQDAGKPFSTMLPIDTLWPLIDFSKIDPLFTRFFESPEIFSNTFGGIMHACLPLNKRAIDDANFPKPIYSTGKDGTPIVFNLDPTGHEAITKTVRRLITDGVPWLAVTTLNRHGQPEISDPSTAKAFINDVNNDCAGQNMKIPVFLQDALATPDWPGSFAQISMIAGDTGVLRDGNVAKEVIEMVTGLSGRLPTDNMKPYLFGRSPASRQTAVAISKLASEGASPQDLRHEILSRITVARP